MSCPATTGSAASAGTAVKDPPSWARSSSSGPRSRATPTTRAPALARAAAMPRPKPRLAPVTSAAAPDISLSGITVLPGRAGEKPGPASIEGSATSVIVPSRSIIKKAPHKSASARQRRGSTSGAGARRAAGVGLYFRLLRFDRPPRVPGACHDQRLRGELHQSPFFLPRPSNAGGLGRFGRARPRSRRSRGGWAPPWPPAGRLGHPPQLVRPVVCHGTTVRREAPVRIGGDPDPGPNVLPPPRSLGGRRLGLAGAEFAARVKGRFRAARGS